MILEETKEQYAAEAKNYSDAKGWVQRGENEGGGEADAFRHAYVSACFTQTGLPGSGLGSAYEWYTAANNDGGPRDRFMDLWNNNYGASVGEKYKRLILDNTGYDHNPLTQGKTDKQIREAIAQEIQNGVTSRETINDYNNQSDNRIPSEGFFNTVPWESVPFWLPFVDQNDPQKSYQDIEDKWKKASGAWEKFKEKWKEFQGWWKGYDVWPETGDYWSKWFGLDRNGHYRIAYYYDPLTLDLDGDGIETVGANGWAGSLFDMDNDGIRAATGWVKSDDGLLVFDRNGNGTIDNGGELFGDHTSLSSGGLAADGFAALADLDANHDGVVDASDADFQSLKIWRDLNQDGVSSADELFTLNQLGIVSLNLTYTNTNQALTGGNVLAQVGSYTMADGTVRQMGDVNLAADQLHTEYAEHIELTPEQASQANIQGMGRLRDLREAAALSGALANMLARYSQAATKAEQLALLDDLILAWAKTDPQWKDDWAVLFSQDGIEDPDSGNVIWLRRGQGMFFIDLTDEEQQRLQSCRRMIQILDAFSGETTEHVFFTDENTADIIESTYANLATAIYESLLLQTRLSPYLDQIGLKLSNDGLELDFTGVEQLFADTYAVNQEKAFVDLAELLGQKGDALRESGWTTGAGLFAGWVAQAERDDSIDRYKQQLSTTGNNNFIIGGAVNGTISGGAGNDLIFGLDGDETLYGNENDDGLYGGAGRDRLYGGQGADSLFGGDGDDYLEDYHGLGNHLYGGAGNDTIKGYGHIEGGSGDDTITGSGLNDTYVFSLGDGRDSIYDYGGGTDTIRLGTGIFAAGTVVSQTATDLILTFSDHDQITLKNWFDGTNYQIERIEFADGTLWTPATIANIPLVLMGTAGQDTLNGGQGKDIIYGGDDDDVLYGNENDDELYGGAGGDRLYGGQGADSLFGGDGDDYLEDYHGLGNHLYGGAGNDTIKGYGHIEGGSGDDTITGSGLNDTYVFSLGDGRDSIYDYGGGADTIRLGTGIFAAGTVASRTATDLILTFSDSDQITLKNWFDGANYQIERIEFADGTLWTPATIANIPLVLMGTAGQDTLNGGQGKDIIYGGDDDDVLYGNENDDELYGGAGGDRLYGGQGADSLSGGDGDDYLEDYHGHGNHLYGGAGNDTIKGYGHIEGGSGDDTITGSGLNDTYVFSLGDGRDSIYDYGGSADTLGFGSGIQHDALWFSRTGNDLAIDVIGTADQVMIKDWFNGPSYQIENIHTGDGKTLLSSQVQNLINAMASFAPPAPGQTSLAADYQQALNPVLAASWK